MAQWVKMICNESEGSGFETFCKRSAGLNEPLQEAHGGTWKIYGHVCLVHWFHSLMHRLWKSLFLAALEIICVKTKQLLKEVVIEIFLWKGFLKL